MPFNPSYAQIVTLAGTMKAAGAILANRFVTFAGAQATSAQATAADAIRGVAFTDAVTGLQFTVNEAGELPVRSGAAITVGQKIGSDDQGRAVPLAENATSWFGRAITAVAGPDLPVTLLKA